MKKYVVELNREERASLEALTRKGTVSARRLKRALALLAADEGAKDEEVAAKPACMSPPWSRFASVSWKKALKQRSPSGHGRARHGCWTDGKRHM